MHPANPENTQKLDETCQKGGKFNQKLSVATVGICNAGTEAPLLEKDEKRTRQEPLSSPFAQMGRSFNTVAVLRRHAFDVHARSGSTREA